VRLAGLPPERAEERSRPFTAHLTLARVQRSAKPAIRSAIDPWLPATTSIRTPRLSGTFLSCFG